MARTRGREAVGPSANWSGTVDFDPSAYVRVRTEGEIIHHLARATAHGMNVRAIGAGHSFMPLAQASGIQMSLDGHRGLVHVDPVSGDVTVRGGTRLWELGPMLAAHGRALAVMGDIDRQSIAGAISTGTHGTGAAYPGFSGLVTGLRIALASGDVVWADADHNPRLFEAARLGLGAFGIITQVRIQTVPLYRMHRREYTAEMSRAVEGLDELMRAHDHAELFWVPGANRCVVRTLNHLPLETAPMGPGRLRSALGKEVLGNGGFALANRVARAVPRSQQVLGRTITALMPSPVAVGDPHRIFAESRRVRFRETEMSIPAHRWGEAFEALSAALSRLGSHIVFPLEVRRVRRDDVWLSGAYERDALYIAAHIPVAEKSDVFLDTVHDVLAGLDGRPHWGKLHHFGVREVAERYPRFEDVREVRDDVDPGRLFTNDTIERVLGP